MQDETEGRRESKEEERIKEETDGHSGFKGQRVFFVTVNNQDHFFILLATTRAATENKKRRFLTLFYSLIGQNSKRTDEAFRINS